MPERVRSVQSYEELPRPLSEEHPTTAPDEPPADAAPTTAEPPAQPDAPPPEPSTAEPPAPSTAEPPPSPPEGMATLILKVGDRTVLKLDNVLDFVGAAEVADKGIMVIPSPSYGWWAWALKQIDFELTNRIAGAKLAAAKQRQQRGIVMASDIPPEMLRRKP